MGHNFVTANRDQAFLMPPSMRDWLPEGHLAWFVLDVVSELDLTEFLAAYRADGRGGAAYDPAMILAIWLYAYCVGEPSTRRIERRCAEDVAFRVLAGSRLQDHSTLSRFRKQHADALVGLFAQILRLCHEAGLVDLSLLAFDGTKVTANAAKDANRELKDLEADVASWLEDADALDAQEESAFSPAQERPVPVGSERRERIREALRQARSDATTNDKIVVAAELTNEPVDRHQLLPMIDAVHSSLEAADIADNVGVLLADAGYWSRDNAAADVDCGLLIATTKARQQDGRPIEEIDEHIAIEEKENLKDLVELDRRATILEKRMTGDISMVEVAEEMGVSLTRAYVLAHAYAKVGRQGIVPAHRPRGRRRSERVRGYTRARQAMDKKLALPENRVLYSRRKVMIEPVFARHKYLRGFSPYSCRGLVACTT
jgi:transposase